MLYANNSDGSSHAETPQNKPSGGPECPHSAYTTETVDGTAVQYLNDQSTYFGQLGYELALIDKDGVIYGGTQGSGSQRAANVVEQDANGNLITEQNFNLGANPDFYYKDSVGRIIADPPHTIPQNNSVSPLCNGPLQAVSSRTWTIPGPNGENSTYTLCYASVHTVTDFNVPNVTEEDASGPVLQSVILPNGTQWEFQYGPSPGDPGGSNYGDLTKVTLPTGGTVSYQYATEFVSWCSRTDRPRRYLVKRRINANDGAGPLVTSYNWVLNGGSCDQYGNSTGAPFINVVVTDPSGNDTVHWETVPPAGVVSDINEVKVQYYQGSYTNGLLLKTVLTDWDCRLGGGGALGDNHAVCFPMRITTQWGNGQTTKVERDYDSNLIGGRSYGNILEERDYAYGNGAPGPLIRRTSITYKAFEANSPYLTAQLLNLKSSVTVYDGNGNQVENTIYGYDETPLDSSGLSLSSQLFAAPPSGSYRGNLTSIQRWLNVASTPCANGHSVPAGGSAITRFTYYDDGMEQSETNPCGITSRSYVYSSTYGGAFPTTVTNALGESTTVGYDIDTGKAISIRDANHNATSYDYDQMGRISRIDYPDGGETSVSWQESSFPFTSTVTTKITASSSRVDVYNLDGFGRISQTELVSDPQGAIYTHTTYDAQGNQASVTSPYRSISDATYGITTYTYDPLGRMLLQANPDDTPQTPSREHWAYTGSVTTFTNENNYSWQRTSDALNRLIQVREPGGLTTQYTYDPLSNLMGVNQLGNSGSDSPRVRNFNYDSLSRLLTAYNPETGTVRYAYDADGNLQTKTDARGITVSYSYDALNRLKSKSYSDGATPSSCYQYDSATNGIGLLSNAWTQSAACQATTPTSGFWTKRSILGYDPMGRLLGEQQYTPANHASGRIYSPQYMYDLAGNLTYSTDGTTPAATTPGYSCPSGATPNWATLTFSNCYDGAGRLSSITSSLLLSPLGSSLPAMLFTATSYAAPGGLTEATFGNGLTLLRSYDKLMRITGETDTGGAVTTATGGSATAIITGSEQSK